MKNISITKASGKSVPFSRKKLKTSLLKSGADIKLINNILKKVDQNIYEGISTKNIYKIAYALLKSQSGHFAAKYHLKRGIMELGPSGFPFEKFIAEIIQRQGFKVETGKIVIGQCVKHEIDIIAEKDHQHFMIECKYHNQPGTVSGVKIPLYIQARFKDVELKWKEIPGHEVKFHQGWVVTNTRFTTDALQYGNCAGLHMLSWDYPKNNSLKFQIDNLGLYPLTCLTSLTRKEKEYFLNKNIVLSKDVLANQKYLVDLGISATRMKTILSETQNLCRVAK